MRVFLTATIDLKKSVPFQETIPHLLALLKAENLAPGRVRFAFQDVPDTEGLPLARTSTGRLIKAFPQLAPYLRPRDNRSSSITTLSNFPSIRGLAYVPDGADPQITPELFAAVARKIPRPFSFYSAAILLDGIPWFGASDPVPALPFSLADAPCAMDSYGNNYNADCSFYQSDCIILNKCFDWGTGYNPIHLRMEVTSLLPAGDFSPALALTEEIAARTGGQLTSREMVCCFPPDELGRLTGLSQSLADFLQTKSTIWQSLPMPSGIPFAHNRCRTPDGPAADPDFRAPSRQSYFKRVLAPHGFIWKNPQIMGPSDFTKITDPGGYALHLSPWFHRNHLNVRLDCAGCNFSLSHMLYSDRPCRSMGDLALCAEDLKLILTAWQADILPELLRLYGPTPPWYLHSISSTPRPTHIIRNLP